MHNMMNGVPHQRDFPMKEEYEGEHRKRQIGIAVQLFEAMGIERDNKEKRTDWVLRGFRQFDAPVSIVVTYDVNVARYADLKIGVVPVINLEWTQKLHRDRNSRGYTTEAVTETILRRMHDYVHYICPQFSETDINFQRAPTVDTSNPFVARSIPTPDESIVVIRFREPRGVDFPYLVNMIAGSWMSRANSIVIPGNRLDLAMQLVLTPRILELVRRKKSVI